MQSSSQSCGIDLGEAELCQTDISDKVQQEFQSAEFGDERLTGENSTHTVVRRDFP